MRGAWVGAPRRDDERGRVDGCEQGLIVAWSDRVAAGGERGRVRRTQREQVDHLQRLEAKPVGEPDDSPDGAVIDESVSDGFRQHHTTVGAFGSPQRRGEAVAVAVAPARRD